MTSSDVIRALCAERIAQALMSVSRGLCYRTAEAKHQQLLDVEKILEGLAAVLNAQPSRAYGGPSDEELRHWIRGHEQVPLPRTGEDGLYFPMSYEDLKALVCDSLALYGAPEPAGEDLPAEVATTVSWLLEASIQAANKGASDAAGKLELAAHLLTQRFEPAEGPASFDLVAHLRRAAEFSFRTWGPGRRVRGVCDHIRKELVEVEAEDGPLSEWIDVIILGFDGANRTGASPEEIVGALVAKQTRNEGRAWPDWRTADPNKAIEHDRTGEVDEKWSAAISPGPVEHNGTGFWAVHQGEVLP